MVDKLTRIFSGRAEDRVPVLLKLRAMFALDQSIRKTKDGERPPFIPGIDEKNTEDLKGIISRFGWPDFSDEGNKIAFAIVQHADHDPDFQVEILNKYGEYMKPKDFAYLYDRIAMQAYKFRGPDYERQIEDLANSANAPKQRYGTQGRELRGVWVPFPIEDEARVDDRRRKMQLSTLAEYIAHMNRPREENLSSAAPSPG